MLAQNDTLPKPSVRGIIPVVDFTHTDQVMPYLDCLMEAGIHTIEITLRSGCALQALEVALQHRQQLSTSTDFLVGAGTICSLEQMQQVQAMGVDYLLSPGSDPALLTYAQQQHCSYIPGIASATDLQVGLSQGYRAFKFFPAGPLGGVPMLKALAAPFSEAQFCPTGGVNLDNFLDYLSLPSVFAVGGSWLAPAAALRAGDWGSIQAAAQAAVAKLRTHEQAAS